MRKKILYMLAVLHSDFAVRGYGFSSYFNKICLSLQESFLKMKHHSWKEVACMLKENAREKAKLFGYFSAYN